MNHKESGIPTETERKYRIAMPDIEALSARPGVRRYEMVQTYLAGHPGITRRVRMRREGETVQYFLTEKRRISDMSCEEREHEISQRDYEENLRQALPGLRPIRKTRLAIPEGGFIWELDIYPFWRHHAILEVELPDEACCPALPDWAKEAQEVTSDRRYKNRALAEAIPPLPGEDEEA